MRGVVYLAKIKLRRTWLIVLNGTTWKPDKIFETIIFKTLEKERERQRNKDIRNKAIRHFVKKKKRNQAEDSAETKAFVPSHCWLLETPRTAARQAPLSMGFSRKECLSGFLCPPPGDLPGPGTEPVSLKSPTWQLCSLPLVPSGKPAKETDIIASADCFDMVSRAWC